MSGSREPLFRFNAKRTCPVQVVSAQMNHHCLTCPMSKLAGATQHGRSSPRARTSAESLHKAHSSRTPYRPAQHCTILLEEGRCTPRLAYVAMRTKYQMHSTKQSALRHLADEMKSQALHWIHLLRVLVADLLSLATRCELA